MIIRNLHPWPATVAQAEAIQEKLRVLVDLDDPGPEEVELVAGLDVAYAADSDELSAAVIVMNTTTLEVVDQVVISERSTFPYIPGLFAFHELPPLVKALEKLQTTPDLLICDGHGIVHPRRFGLACHLGVLTGLPTIGVAKSIFIGQYGTPEPERGAWAPISEGEEIIGRALRTRTNTKPVFVSQGHLISLENACNHILKLSPVFRIPEPIRKADQAVRRHQG